MTTEPIGISVREAAERTGLSVHTLRYYERIGLVDPVGRGNNGHRRYSDGDVGMIEFLKCLRATGMPIETMKRYMDAQRRGEITLDDRLTILREHRAYVTARIDEMNGYLKKIDWKIDYYAKESETHG